MLTRSFARWTLPCLAAALSLTACSTATLTNAVDPEATGGLHAGISGAAGALARGGSASSGVPSSGGLVVVGGAGASGAGASGAGASGAPNGGSNHSAGAAPGPGGTFSTAGTTVNPPSGGINGGGGSAGGGSAATGGDGFGGSGAGGSVSTTGGSTITTGGAAAGAGGSGVAGTTGVAGGSSTGTGGAPPCVSDSDCAALNPEIYSCMAVCQAARCKVLVDGAQIQGKAFGSDLPVTGAWDATNRPYLVTAPWKQSDQNATISIQQLRANGTANGAIATYTLPADVAQPLLITAVRRGSGLGVLWSTKSLTAPLLLTQFAEMSLSAVGAAPATLMTSDLQTSSPETVYALGLAAVGASDWILSQFSGTPAAWRGDVTSFANASTSLTPLQPVLPRITHDDAAFALVGTTAMMTGWSCTTFRDSTCKPQLQVNRHSTTDLSLMGSSITVSSVAYDSSVTGARKFSPAIGDVGGRLAMFWNENGPSRLLLGRTLISEVGGYVKVPEATETTLVPKAVAASQNGGGILFAERLSTVTGDTEFVAQKFDATLTFVGEAVVISSLNAASPGAAEVRASSDGRLLVTYQHGGPRFSLLHADLCQ